MPRFTDATAWLSARRLARYRKTPSRWSLYFFNGLLVARDYGLPSNWMNTAVGGQWKYGLPDGFLKELEWVQYGGLEVGFAGRRSLIALKLFAAVDQGPGGVHVQDLLTLAPTKEELSLAAEWVATQDASEVFKGMLEEVVAYVLGRA